MTPEPRFPHADLTPIVGAETDVAPLGRPGSNVAFLVALAFAVAASANLPVIVLSLYWRRFNTAGAVCCLGTGLLASLILILLSPSILRKNAILPLENPGIVSIPLGFLGAVVGTLLSREPEAERKFTELSLRANTGLGAEPKPTCPCSEAMSHISPNCSANSSSTSRSKR
ncbi:MAG: hypothetical protein H7A18_13065 [Sinobacteraceae bacterium]|nr:hypothetical protein [Nevskiaceae bacterium]MCP5472980.1 hypothetical protein [Nevskiaceae bacterium]